MLCLALAPQFGNSSDNVVNVLRLYGNLRRAAHAMRSRFDLDDEVEVYNTATTENLMGEDSVIWSNIDELSELLSLDEL